MQWAGIADFDPSIERLLFSFELCLNSLLSSTMCGFGSCMACYFLLNYASMGSCVWCASSVALVLLFSFELCGGRGQGGVSNAQVHNRLLFSFELCLRLKQVRDMTRKLKNLLFSFELCSSMITIAISIGVRDAYSCYFLLNYANKTCHA